MPFRSFTRANYEYYLNRLGNLSSDSQARWGTMTPTAMLSHLVFTFEMGSGKQSVEDQSTLLTRTVVRFVACDLLKRFPRGRVQVDPKMTPEPKGPFEEERKRVIAAMNEFLDAIDKEPKRRIIHPAFGSMTLEYSARVQGIHVDHHLQQFGV